MYVADILTELSSKCAHLWCYVGILSYGVQLVTDPTYIAHGLFWKINHANHAKLRVNQHRGTRWHLCLDQMRCCSIDIVQDTYKLAVCKIHIGCVSPRVSGATGPFPDLLAVSEKADVQTTMYPQ